ncbi:MAG: O-antigen ligase family protein [Chitinophagaceae bacterium]
MNSISTSSLRSFYFCSFLFALLCAVGLCLQQPVIAASGVFIIIAIWLVQNPILLMYVLLAAIPWSVEYSVTGTLSTDLPDEPLMLLLSLFVLAFSIFHRHKIFPFVQRSPLLALLLVQFIWMMITVMNSTNVFLSLKFLLAKSWYLLAFVGGALIFFRDKKNILTSALVLIASMLILTITVLSRHSITGFTFDTINVSVTPFFRNHVTYSASLVCTTSIIYLFVQNSVSSKRKYVFIFLLLLSLVALYFSYARGAWIAFIAGGISIWLLKKQLLLPAFLIAVFIVVTSFLWLKKDSRYIAFAHDYNTTIFHKDFQEHLIATYKLKDVSTAERFYRWIAGVRMAKEYWHTGSGPNTFYPNYKSYTIPLFRTWVSKNEDRSTVHNYFLLTLVEQGVMGLLLLLSLIGYMYYVAQKIYKRSRDGFWKTTAICIASILSMICTLNFLSDLIETDKVGSIFYLCLGTLIVADLKTRPESDPSPHI